MNGPSTYADWSILFKNFGDGDDLALNEMQKGQFLMDAGTASRFCVIAEEAYKKRKQLWLTNFQRAASMENIKSEGDFEIVLRNGKQSLVPLSKFTVLKSLPEELINVLQKDLEDFVDEIKRSLKGNLSISSSGNERMVMQLNNFILVSCIDEDLVASGKDVVQKIPRKIIF